MFDFIKNLFGSSTADLGQLIENGAVVLDVRTKAEYDAGHIKGSKHIPLDRIKTQVEGIRKLNKPVITVCRSGSRSAMAKNILSSAGVEVYNGGSWLTLKNKYAMK
ncbi:MAG TPA: rhodanese-like domain-containing protein [Chitinophagaceae bacterium]